MPIYSLLLNSIASAVYTAPVKTNQGLIAGWYLNYDDLFRKENYKFNKCRLRMNMVSNLANGVAFQTSLSYIGCNLASTTNSTNTINPSPINLFGFVDSNTTIQRNTNPELTNTSESQGTNISVPKGSGLFTIQIGDMNDMTSLLVLAAGVSIGYQIHLQFELY